MAESWSFNARLSLFLLNVDVEELRIVMILDDSLELKTEIVQHLSNILLYWLLFYISFNFLTYICDWTK